MVYVVCSVKPAASAALKAEVFARGAPSIQLDEPIVEVAAHRSSHSSLVYQVFDGAHLAVRQRADLALDTPIYNGHTTMAELLWAAVPVVTVAGDASACVVCFDLLRRFDRVGCHGCTVSGKPCACFGCS